MNIFWIVLAVGFIGGQLFTIGISDSIRTSVLDIAVFLLVGQWFIRTFDKRVFYKYLGIFGPFILSALLALALNSFRLQPADISVAALYLVRFVLYSLVFCVSSPDGKKSISAYILFTAGVSLALLGFVQYFLYPNLRNLSYLGWDPHQYRMFSTLLDPNFLGIILLLTLILTVFLISQEKRHTYKHLYIFCFVLVSAALFLTYSRGTYTAYAVVVTVWTMKRRRFLTLLTIYVLLLSVLFLLPRPGGEGVNLFRVMSVESRIANSIEAWSLLIQSPLIGHGFNTLPFVRHTSESDIMSRSAGGFHTSYLFVLATTGLIGLGAYIFLWKKLLETTASHNLLRYSLLAVGVHSLFDNSLFYPWVMVWLWLIAGRLLRKGNK